MKKRYSLMILAFSTAVVMLLASCAVKTQETPGLRAEAAHEEFYQRFQEAPDAVMSYLVLVDE